MCWRCHREYLGLLVAAGSFGRCWNEIAKEMANSDPVYLGRVIKSVSRMPLGLYFSAEVLLENHLSREMKSLRFISSNVWRRPPVSLTVRFSYFHDTYEWGLLLLGRRVSRIRFESSTGRHLVRYFISVLIVELLMVHNDLFVKN